MKSEKTKDLLERYKRLNHMKEDWVDKYSDSLLQKDGKAHILVDIREEDVMSPYSDGRILSPDLVDYIQREAQFIKSDELLAIDFKVEDKSDSRNKGIAKQLKEQFLFRFSETKKKKRKVLRETLIFLITGILFILLYIILNVLAYQFNGINKLYLTILSDVIDIVSWVFIWEAADKFFFERRGVQEEMFKMTQLATCEINFID